MNEVEVVSELSGVSVQNYSGLSTELLQQDPQMREIAAQLSTWVNNARSASRKTTMFDRGAFTPPEHVYDEMQAARTAVRYDDIVSGVAEITEAFAFQGVKWESEEPDDADVFNQINAQLNLDAVVRRMWREEYTYSQSVVAAVWGWKTFTVRGRSAPKELPLEAKTDPMTGEVTYAEPLDPETNRPKKRPKGVKRKKKVRVWCPTKLTILDSTKVVPVGRGPFAGERLAWMATEPETDRWSAVHNGTEADPGISLYQIGHYAPDDVEREELGHLGVDVENLLEMNPNLVWRHTLTKPDYEKFADVRMKSCFTLLDMKRQLLHSDRATLIGAANYILLIRKGSKDEPASQVEIDNLKSQYNFIAKLPVIISDHRLEIDIIAPKTDLVLDADKYDVLDTRLLARLLGTLSLGGRGQRNETNVTLSQAVAKTMESRRHMLKRTLEDKIGRAVVEHPLNDGLFDQAPSLVYTPRHIALGVDAALTQALVGLRANRELSRETILEYFGLDQGTEAQRMELEGELFDQIFKSQVAFSGPQQLGPNGQPMPPQVSGGQGGRPVGGGEPSTGPTKVTKRSASGQASPKKDGA